MHMVSDRRWGERESGWERAGQAWSVDQPTHQLHHTGYTAQAVLLLHMVHMVHILHTINIVYKWYN